MWKLIAILIFFESSHAEMSEVPNSTAQSTTKNIDETMAHYFTQFLGILSTVLLFMSFLAGILIKLHNLKQQASDFTDQGPTIDCGLNNKERVEGKAQCLA